MCQPIEKFTQPVEPPVPEREMPSPPAQQPSPPLSLPPPTAPAYMNPVPTFAPYPEQVRSVETRESGIRSRTQTKTLYEMLETESKFVLSSFLCVYIAFSIHQDMYPVHTTRGIVVRSAFSVALLFFIHRVLSMNG